MLASWQSAPHGGEAPRTLALTIVIPALNEEGSIGATIQRCLDAREHIRRAGRVHSIHLVVVSDGSSDRTAEIARTFADREPSVSLIVFEHNRGYGAAIKEGFARSSGDLVAFLDADGTCDPRFFADLCMALQQREAAVAIGSRMGRGTQMPLLRRLGNKLYALLLGSLSGEAVSDIASGMRVIRRDTLAELYPLPDGLHFTPAMSARAIMSSIPIVEVPMPYAQRVGHSKLRILRDGVRFLIAIGDAVLLYHPSRVFGLGLLLSVAACILVGMYPTEFYLRNRRLEEWMIYRFLLCGLLFTSAFGLLSASVLSAQTLSLVYKRQRPSFLSHFCDRLLSRTRSWLVAGLATMAALALVWPALSQYVQTGHVLVHWSRPLAAVFLVQIALVAVIHTVMRQFVDLWKGQLSHHSTSERRTDVPVAASAHRDARP